MSGASVPVAFECEGLGVGRQRVRVLRDVCMRIPSGALVAIVGPNGHGKSTLLQTMLGLLPPLSGSLRWREDLRDRRALGFVPQRCDLDPAIPITVAEFVRLGLAGIPARGRDAADRVAWALSRVTLPGVETRSYWSLSGGQRQRALVARALVRRPALLALDEPTAGLDLAGEEALVEGLGRLRREEGTTILLVTHALRIVMREADSAVLVSGGVATAGPVTELLSPAGVSAAFQVSRPAAEAALALAPPRTGEEVR